MAILAGIDEAGLGPIMGPLVVSATVFRISDGMLEKCLWRVLAGTVTRKAFRRSPALPVADSKAMHVRSDGVVHLERGVLGMLRLQKAAPESLAGLLELTCPAALGRMREYPWYSGQSLPLPRQADVTDVALRSNAAAEQMRRCGIVLEALRSETIFAGEYNRLVEATRNKAVALFGVASRLIDHVFRAYGAQGPVRIIVDRHGGRSRYLIPLQRMFPGAAIRIVEESQRQSRYLLRDGQRSIDIRFLTDGDADVLPVALASMLSKYVRELFMELLNRWWADRVGGLRHTAGYFKDGRRFLRDIEAAIVAEGVDRSLLIRSR